MKLNVNYEIFWLFFVVSLFLGFVVRGSVFPNYLDECVYIGCGVAYVSNFTPPVLCNFEHPPFAKYVIGFFHILGFSRILFMFFYALSCYLLFLVLYMLSHDLGVSLFSSLLLFFDTLFFNTYRFLLLDPVAVVLSLASLYLALSAWHGASAALAGLAFASKFSSAPTILVSFYAVLRRRGFGEALKFLVIAFLTYLATYFADFRLGPLAIVEHNVQMLSYMGWRHGFSPALASIGFLKLLTKVELWRFGGNITIFITSYGSYWSVYSTMYAHSTGLYTVVGVGLGSPAWYLLFPLLLYTTYHALVHRGDVEVALCTWGWLSLLNVLAGPIDWYYINALPALYTNAGYALKKISGKRFKYISLPLLASSIITFYTTLLGLLPYTIKLS